MEFYYNGELIHSEYCGYHASSLIPIMSSSSSELSNVKTLNIESGMEYLAFNGNITEGWGANTVNGTSTGMAIGYDFGKPVIVGKIEVYFNSGAKTITDMIFKAQYSDDGINWVDCKNILTNQTTVSATLKYDLITSIAEKHKCWRAYVASASKTTLAVSGQYASTFVEVKMYGTN